MNGYISQDKIIEIKNNVDIVDIISSYIPLQGKGKNLFGVCPFHDDHSPSMSVSREKQIYTCFSCGATGNVFNFIMDYEHISFPEALKICADKAGIVLDNINVKHVDKNKDLFDMYEVALKLYQNNINTKSGIDAIKYLEDRNITKDIIKEFKIGLALHDNKLSKLLDKKYDNNLLDSSGLINLDGINKYDAFTDRIMIPIENLEGKIVGFSGRIYKPTDKKIGKYKNTKETKIFKKGELLYNYHRAKEYARETKTIIIMEGYMDLFRAYLAGVKNVVVSMGTAVTKEQATLLKRIANNIILCFDGDSAGEKATYACSNELMKMGIVPKIVRLPDNLDPDEFILKNGKDAFIEKINNPISVMEFKMNYLKNNKDLNNSNEMSSYVNEVINELNNIQDDILREITINKLSAESNLDVEFIRSRLIEVDKDGIKNIELKPKPKIKLDKNISMYIKAEQYLLYYMLNNIEVIKMYQKRLGYMPTDKYRKLAFEITYFYKNNGYISISDLMISLNDNQDILDTLKEINILNLKENYSIEQIDDYINTIRKYNIKEETKRLKDLMSMEIDPIKKAEYADKILEIKKMNEVGE